MEVKSKRYGTPQYKSMRISDWKRSGVICEDFDMLYKEYIKTTNCQHCGIDFKSTRDRHLDHNHITGEFRAFVCHKCNSWDSYIKYPNGYHKKKHYEKNKDHIREQQKEHYEKNKDRKREYMKEYGSTLFQCMCGEIIRTDSMSKHIKRQIHNNPFCDYPKTNIFM
jgi:hypothetical protein